MSQPSIETTEAKQAPACFGSPSCYAGDSDICKACSANDTCGDQMLKTLERIKGVINVEDLLHKHRQALAKQRSAKVEQVKKTKELGSNEVDKPIRATPSSVERKTKAEKITFEIDDTTQELIGKLPVKAQPFAISMCKTGLVNRIKKDMARNINPLEKTGPKFMAIGLKLLLNGGFTKSQLREVFINELNWTENSSASHVSLVVRLFTMFNIAIESDSKIVANPTLMTEN